MLRTIANRRTLITAALLAALALGGFGLLQAGPSHHTEYTYYSDATKSEIVGIRILPCSGGQQLYGKMSRYWDLDTFHQCQ